MSLKESTANNDFDLVLKEDDEYLYFSYKMSKIDYCLIYNKEKDICMVVKDGRAADLKSMSSAETERYKEVLDIAICYHHDRTVEYLI